LEVSLEQAAPMLGQSRMPVISTGGGGACGACWEP
jgi:hypothetical protein